MTVEIASRIEDEITQTIEDGLPPIGLHRLSGVRMMAHQTVGSRIYQLTSLITLTGHYLHVDGALPPHGSPIPNADSR